MVDDAGKGAISAKYPTAMYFTVQGEPMAWVNVTVH
jgi:hypothetical protein